MIWQFSPFSPFLFLTGALSLWLAWRIRQRHGLAGRAYLSLLMLNVGLWSLFNGLQLLAVPLEAVQYISAVQYIFIQNIGPLWLLYSISYARQHPFSWNGKIWLLWVIPGIVLLLVWTNDFHHLFWTEITQQETPYGIAAIFTYGPGIILNTSYAYGLMLLGAGTLLFAAFRSPSLQRRQITVLLAAVFVPLAGNAVNLALEPVPGLDLTPPLFAVSGFLLLLSTSRLGFMEIVPVVHDQLFESLSSGVLVLDKNDRVIDFNPAAAEIFELHEPAIGIPVEALFSAEPGLLASLSCSRQPGKEILIQTPAQPRWLEVRKVGLPDPMPVSRGSLLICKDISQRKKAEQQIQEAAHHLLLLNEIAETAMKAPDLASMLQIVADRMAALIYADACYITFWNEARRLTIPAAASGLLSERFQKTLLKDGDLTLTRSVVEQRAALVVEDKWNTPYISLEVAERLPSQSLLGIPITSGEKTLGAILFGFHQHHRYTESEIRRCEHAGRQISLAIVKMQFLEDARRHAARLVTLNRIGMTLTSGMKTEQVIRSIFEQCQKVVQMDTFSLALYDEKTAELSFPLYYSQGEYRQPGTRPLSTITSMVRFVLKTRQTLHISDALDAHNIPHFAFLPESEPPSGAAISVPMLLKDRILGVIAVQSQTPHAYSPEDVHLFEILASQAAVALENARLYADLKRQAALDELTGLYNYRSLLELGTREVERAQRFARCLSAIFFDIDHFREVNNRFSHAVGNQVLARVAEFVRLTLRRTDLPFRVGGEEFVLLLPETTLAEAGEIAERLRSGIESLVISTDMGELQVTISLGAAGLTAEVLDLQDLVDRANQAELCAKRAGRNRFEVHIV